MHSELRAIEDSELPCGRDRRASENCMFIFGVIPACRESFFQEGCRTSGHDRLSGF